MEPRSREPVTGESRSVAARRPVLVAHTPGKQGLWHDFYDHAVGVGELAAGFAAPFHADGLLRLMGNAHDLGKAKAVVQQAFDRCYRTGEGRLGVGHKQEGASLGAYLLGGRDRAAQTVMTLGCLGHHSGMPDAQGEEAKSATHFGWRDTSGLELLLHRVDQGLADRGHPTLTELATRATAPAWVDDELAVSGTAADLFVRMCHSCLVDADFLDTAGHFDPGRDDRPPDVGLAALLRSLLDAQATIASGAAATELNRRRQAIFEQARAAGRAARVPGAIYRLPAATGTGKTYSAAAFALEHAVANEKRRVVVAVPFTSITTQNAAVYRQAFAAAGEHVVLEHHSNITDDEEDASIWRRLSAENWDAEFIVTTTVQLFESLFSNRPSATRKLHRLVDSVIVLDEVQAIPFEVLPSVLRMLRDLTERFGVTVLLASATQPSFWAIKAWEDVPFVDILSLDEGVEVEQRVTYDIRQSPLSWADVAGEVGETSQGLIVLNTTGDAATLYRELAARRSNVLHLSTRMTNAHRLTVLDEVRARLSADDPVVLVSTQLIEAGVDLDFPLVLRAEGPAASIIQAAGRCNREGRLGPRGGRVIVFRPSEGSLPPGNYRHETLRTHDHFIDGDLRFDSALDLDSYSGGAYRDFLDEGHTEQSRPVDEYRQHLEMRRTATAFQMITTYGVDVLVIGDDRRLREVSDAIRSDPRHVITRAERRLISRHSCRVSPTMCSPATVAPVGEQLREWIGTYDTGLGCVADVPIAGELW